MSFFAKVKFGNDSQYQDASNVATALREAGYEVNERPENGELYFSEGEE